MCDILWADGVEPSPQKPRGHGEAWLDRRGHTVKVFGFRREYDGVAWGSVPSGGPLWKRSPRHTPGSRRVPKSPCTPFPCLCRPSVSYWPCTSASAGLPRGPQNLHVSLSEFGPPRHVRDCSLDGPGSKNLKTYVFLKGPIERPRYTVTGFSRPARPTKTPRKRRCQLARVYRYIFDWR